MLNLLGATNTGSIIGIVVLLVILVAYFVLGTMNRKKNQEKAMQMLNELKIGDKVVTNAGIYGEIVAMKETDMGKVVTIKTGDEESKKFGYISVNASVILGVDVKRDLILDAEGNVIDPEEKKEEVLKENFKAEEPTEKEEKTEEKEETKPAKKATKKVAPKPAEQK